MAAVTELDTASRAPRLPFIDLARGIAIVAMVIYHTGFDLSANGLIATDVASDLRWTLFARSIAGSFLLLVGIGLVLATRNGFNRRAYLRRLTFIAAGALLVTAGTFWFDRSTFVFFGILHEIAVASVLALPFLAAPSWLVAVVAAAIIAAPWFLANPVFNAWPLWWVGLSTEPPVTIDYVPLLPWFGLVLSGIVVGRLLIVPSQGWLSSLRPRDPVSRLLMRAGRVSLAIYLIHQPLIVGALSLYTTLFPPSEAFLRDRFVGQCATACIDEGSRDAGSCHAVCGCMFDGLYGTDLYTLRSTEQMNADQQSRWDAVIDRCRSP